MPKVWAGTTIESQDDKRLKTLCKKLNKSPYAVVRMAILDFLKRNE